MVVEDRGSGIELPTLEALLEAEPKFETEPVDGGMGLAIIRAIVDELDVRGGDDGRGTVVHMTKYLSEPAIASE
jgi:anti-sigma regulatory factor (Ser/Thr protein kinase)